MEDEGEASFFFNGFGGAVTCAQSSSKNIACAADNSNIEFLERKSNL